MLKSVRTLPVTYVVGMATVVNLTACSKSSPNQPTTATASVTVPKAVKPLDGTVIPNAKQPATLTVKNALTTSGGVTYTFEVATDAGFTTKVQTKSGILEDVSGQTSVTLDALAAGKDFYWHARTEAGGTQGVFSSPIHFIIGPAVALTAPLTVSPISGAATGARPALTVKNSSKTGPAGPLSYRFDIAENSSFSPVIATGTVAESSNTTTAGQTAFIPTTDLNANQTYYWRAFALDQGNSVTSAASTTESFITSLAIDLRSVVISYTDAPREIASWKQTGRIRVVEQDGAGAGLMCIGFDLFADWPSVPFFGDPTVPVYANQWYFARIGGQWYAGPGEYLRADRSSSCKSGQGTNGIGPDGGWNNAMRTWVPKPGELVGYMISTPARNYSVHKTIDNRTDVVLQPWHDSALQGFVVAPGASR